MRIILAGLPAKSRCNLITGASTVTGTVGTYNVTYDAPDFAGNPDIVHVQEIPQLSLSSESSNLLITPASTVTDSVDYPYLTDSLLYK